MYRFIYYFMIFLFYAVAGYICEITTVSLANKKIVLSRGYLIGPIIPIFGFGGLIVTIFLKDYVNDPLTAFVLGTFYCCSLEYVTSYLMEKIYGLRWWDYSDKKFNINGRVCLETGVLFGTGSLFIINIINPILFTILNMIPKNVLLIIGTILLSLVLIDFSISTNAVVKLKIDTKKYNKKDATKEIREQVLSSIKKHSYFYNRILKAFPNMNLDDNRIEKINLALKNLKEMRRVKHEKK